jgi:hypothetical protein
MWRLSKTLKSKSEFYWLGTLLKNLKYGSGLYFLYMDLLKARQRWCGFWLGIKFTEIPEKHMLLMLHVSGIFSRLLTARDEGLRWCHIF